MGTAGHEILMQLNDMTSHMEFAELYERHYATVYRAALRIIGNPADAEDILQTVFLRVLNQGSRLNPAALQQAYFRRASANAAVDLLRRRVSHAESRLAESRLEDASPSAAVESQLLLKERLRRAIATLETNDAVLFLLRYVEGLSNGELAEMFELDKNSIAVRLYRIRQTLQAELER
jgi:RNA polymerase sigma-70 factor (ECF subfamily)